MTRRSVSTKPEPIQKSCSQPKKLGCMTGANTPPDEVKLSATKIAEYSSVANRPTIGCRPTPMVSTPAV